MSSRPDRPGHTLGSGGSSTLLRHRARPSQGEAPSSTGKRRAVRLDPPELVAHALRLHSAGMLTLRGVSGQVRRRAAPRPPWSEAVCPFSLRFDPPRSALIGMRGTASRTGRFRRVEGAWRSIVRGTGTGARKAGNFAPKACKACNACRACNACTATRFAVHARQEPLPCALSCAGRIVPRFTENWRAGERAHHADVRLLGDASAPPRGPLGRRCVFWCVCSGVSERY
jgi:hypothetical protein